MKTAKSILRAVRERSINSGRVGFWTDGTIVVTCDRREGCWTYDVGTYAKSHAAGKPAEVLSALESLLAG